MRQAPDLALLDEREQRADVDARRLEQHFAEGAPALSWKLFFQVPLFLFDDPPHEREAVRMHARAGEAENEIAGPNFGPGKHLVALDGADAEAGEVVVAIRVHAGHFGGFAAN